MSRFPCATPLSPSRRQTRERRVDLDRGRSKSDGGVVPDRDASRSEGLLERRRLNDLLISSALRHEHNDANNGYHDHQCARAEPGLSHGQKNTRTLRMAFNTGVRRARTAARAVVLGGLTHREVERYPSESVWPRQNDGRGAAHSCEKQSCAHGGQGARVESHSQGRSAVARALSYGRRRCGSNRDGRLADRLRRATIAHWNQHHSAEPKYARNAADNAGPGLRDNRGPGDRGESRTTTRGCSRARVSPRPRQRCS
jgi:hypothetical protein